MVSLLWKYIIASHTILLFLVSYGIKFLIKSTQERKGIAFETHITHIQLHEFLSVLY